MWPVSSTVATRRRTWAWLSIIGGAVLFVGELLHPVPASGLEERQAVATELGDRLWIPAHALSLTGVAVLLIGMIAFVSSHRASGSVPDGLTQGARRAAFWVAVALGLYVIQAIPHLLAFVDRNELLAGQATPVLYAYYGLTIVAYPLFGFSVAALAWLSGRTLTHPMVNLLVAIIAVAFGLAPILHVLTDIVVLDLLFWGAAAVALWFVAIGISALARQSRQHRAARTP
jgi:hypothetical protein